MHSAAAVNKHEIQTTFDNSPAFDVIGLFLDISNAFDKVWHTGLLFKLKADGVDGELFSLLENYLENRKLVNRNLDF